MEVKEEAKNVLFWSKGRIKGEKYITPMDFAEYRWKLDVSVNSKVYCVQFFRWDAQYLEVC